MMVNAYDALLVATHEVPAAPARFALVLQPSQDPAERTSAVLNALIGLGATVKPLSSLDPRVLVVELPGRVFTDPASSFEAAYALADQFDVEAAEPDLPTDFFPDSTSGEIRFAEESAGFPPGCWVPERPQLYDNPLWALKNMNVPEAWKYSQDHDRPDRGDGIIVAQPDTGVTAHRELAGTLTVPGYDVLDRDSDPTDPLGPGGNPGHGTATASVLVASETPTVTGSAPKARHMPIRAIRSVIRVSQVSVAEAIDWATDHGAHVITMSLGGLFSFSLHRALRRAVAADVVVLAAAGNCVRTVVWPARYEECVAVGGVNWEDVQWPGSCRGPAVDVSAPAENVLRATVRNGDGARDFGQGQGTSFAVALTAGVAALWLAHHGRANLIGAARARGETLQAMFLRLVRATARRPTDWKSFEMGAGVVDARALLAADFDLGRDRETLSHTAGADVTVRSLVAEAVSPEAAVDDELDWHRFGPELSFAMLREQQVSGGLQAETPAAPADLSATLAKALTNPKLLRRFGLHTSEPEVGVKGES
ncbi:S8 family serine peptidase [Lentzea sp. BCCO 10_0061]|uniref:S8 family serine peptidase n=1 Tax=Lentzea sokolovensis TaxID=3095429 RepID=A0ABU4VC71_9PSEU|nr:S8 family serine peptidase [Lentzea sp. BCCO 10_0061]MDX8148789.1 S8 family serine peptidase [Lentzea sp. BCCO 10_0061]